MVEGSLERSHPHQSNDCWFISIYNRPLAPRQIELTNAFVSVPPVEWVLKKFFYMMYLLFGFDFLQYAICKLVWKFSIGHEIIVWYLAKEEASGMQSYWLQRYMYVALTPWHFFIFAFNSWVFDGASKSMINKEPNDSTQVIEIISSPGSIASCPWW